jgi:selenocysteine-specific elongation factor
MGHQVNITLGTAGHIDHGKTALIRLLTGCETDRLKEEKERGMSIELGFAPCQVAGVEIGIVDVPGHENFVKTMVAGATGIDGVILVIAADDGIMPQTLEHLQILTLLGVEHGVVALTKIDRATSERRDRVGTDIENLLLGTFLEGAPILPISNITGEGFDGFYKGLADLVHSITPKRTDGLFRMPVERAFSVKGYGTVVSGIPVSGSARVGDELELLPQHVTGRIRGIEAYGKTSDTVMAGQCAALQFRHWDHNVIERGNSLAVPGTFASEEWLLVRLRVLPTAGLALDSGARAKFHSGTCDVLARVYPLEGLRMEAGGEYVAQIHVDTPVVVAPRDRFVIRALSPVTTVGGGVIIESMSRRLKRNRPGVRDDATERAEAILDEKGFAEYAIRHAEDAAATPDEIAFRTKIPAKRLETILAGLTTEGAVSRAPGGRFMHRERASQIDAAILASLDAFHREEPASIGVAPDRLQEMTGVEKDLLTAFLDRLRAAGAIALRNGLFALPGHRAAMSDAAHQAAALVEALFKTRAFAPPTVDEAAAAIGVPPKAADAARKTLIEHGALIKVAPDMYFHKSAIDLARQRITAHIEQKGSLPSVDFKYLIDTTRKFAIPLLDYFDKIGVTLRIANTRYLKKK